MLDFLLDLSAFQDICSTSAGAAGSLPLGVIRSARIPIIAWMWRERRVPILVITDRIERQNIWFDEMGFWNPDTKRLTFAEPVPLFYERASWGNTTRRERIEVLASLSRYHLPGVDPDSTPPIIISTTRALMTRTMPRRDFLKAILRLRQGHSTAPEKLIRQLVTGGYQPIEIVTEPGQFSRRGGILDIWSMSETHPFRIDYFGDEMESLRLFDPASQRAVRNVDAVIIPPAREYLVELDASAPENGKEISEFDIPSLHPYPASLLDHLPAETLVVFDDLTRAHELLEQYEEDAVRLRAENLREGIMDAGQGVPYLSWSEIEDSLTRFSWMDLGFGQSESRHALAERFSPNHRFGGRLELFITHLQQGAERGEKQFVVSRQIPRLMELWKEEKPPIEERTPVVFLDGSLQEGWSAALDSGTAVSLFTDSEIFGWEKPFSRQRQMPGSEAPESRYADLRPGDWVVHVDHGIGRFSGLVTRTLEGIEREFLRLEYHDGDQLFVPIHQADRVTRFIGPDGSAPSPTRLGGGEWTQTKARVSAAVEAVAEDLLDLYTRRQTAEGFAFEPDSAWQVELEASFPYVETTDQMAAIQNVKADMESRRPMDRLLCGDVGYGKTEVALRAAFKSVMNGKQVGLLVPTTVLAQQHYETFQRRLLPFPVSVEMLSRFRSPREQDEIIRKLVRGEIDILIGTHRLISQDVAFKDLGLVIIDEEQRFGVTHKEHLKKLRTEVDVLTLTATPIPRTLYMALTGVRDISTINTPPDERLPIITHVGPYSPKIVRQAITRELERGGQVFFVHNRVQTIPAMLLHLKQLVPEARIGIGHGQMDEQALASVMHQFTAGEIDILLCTSIIESGLDIPNANTLIVDRADTFGLAQLYQLRGRVGRGAQRAYAYFFKHNRRPATLEGQERLDVIAENTQLGAGYSIAMRDLEMRGAGEILGTRQSGYIASVGFHLYTRLLGQAVENRKLTRGLTGTTPAPGILQPRVGMPVTVDLPMTAEIPASYVPEQELRLRLYRRLADLDTPEALDAVRDEFTDRFGTLPIEAENLLVQLRVKLLAEKAGLISISPEAGSLVLRYPALPEGTHSRALPVLGGNIRAGKNAYWIKYDPEDIHWQKTLLDALEELGNVGVPPSVEASRQKVNSDGAGPSS